MLLAPVWIAGNGYLRDLDVVLGENAKDLLKDSVDVLITGIVDDR